MGNASLFTAHPPRTPTMCLSGHPIFRLIALVGIACAAATAHASSCEELYTPEKLELARRMVECDLGNYKSNCVAPVDPNDFIYSQNFESYEVQGKAQWDEWLGNFFALNPDVRVRVVRGAGEFCTPTRYAAEWTMNMTFQPSGDTLLDVEGASVITFKAPDDDTMTRMKDYSPDMEIYGLLPRLGSPLITVKRAIDQCLKTEGGCETEEAMMNITSALMGDMTGLQTNTPTEKK